MTKLIDEINEISSCTRAINLREELNVMINKINEIIDYLNKKDEEGKL